VIVTARQVQELHKSNGHVRLPPGARLTPMASDWLRGRRIEVVYADASPVAQPTSQEVPLTGRVLWWCDGPCGQAKAAIAQQSRETFMQPFESKTIVQAVKHLAGEIKADRAAAGVLVVQSAALAVVFSNRCPSLRAILGTCREAVQQGIEQLAANVLIIEHPYQSLGQMRNLLGQFIRGRRKLSDEVKEQLQELASCG
jgi:hypothetical protein